MPCFLSCHNFVSHAPRQKSAKDCASLLPNPSRQTRQFPANRWRRSSGPADALAHSMQLVPNQFPPERLIASMGANERTAPVDTPDSPFVPKGATAMSDTSRWLFI